MVKPTRIREARQAAGLSQAALERMTGIRRTYLSDLELHKRVPTLETLSRLADALGCEMADLLALPARTPTRFKASHGRVP
jgi:transcriptional regulator with XRE-family HTH domain